MSTLHHESILEDCFEQAITEFCEANKLTPEMFNLIADHLGVQIALDKKSKCYIRGEVSVMDNYTAFLTLIGDINNSFSHLEDEDSADICDGDIKLLDKAVKRFKTTVWENQL